MIGPAGDSAEAARVPRRAILAGGAALLYSARLRAEDGAEVLEAIARARAPVRTLRGPFTQVRTIGLLVADIRSRGTLSLLRPDRLRWQLEPPDDVTFWVGPEGLAYRSAHDQGRAGPASPRIASALDDIRTVLGGDLSRLRERWRLVVLRHDATGAELQAEAREAPAGVPRSMSFALAADLVRPTRVTLVVGARDRTVIDFGELAINAPIDEASMRPPS